jgi:Ala-tRNA(Pro) deacylase
MIAGHQTLFQFLDQLGISTVTHDHPPFFTVEDGRSFKAQMPGGHSKNLFVKDKKGALFLIVAWAETQIDLNGLSKDIAASRLSFCSPEIMAAILGVTPGSVTPFALINDREKSVRVVLDQALLSHSPLYFHPLTNTASTAISAGDLQRFLADLGYAPLVRRLERATMG